MVKKKKTDQEETKSRKHIETTDNEDNNQTPDNNLNYQSEKSAGENAEKTDTEPETKGDSSSDTVVSEEMSPEEKLAEMQDKYIRLSAEFDNYRKRTLREKMELVNCAGEEIIVKLIPIMDDFERALKSMESPGDYNALKNGIDLIYNKFMEFLKQNGVTEIESINKDFNVDLHEAVAKIPVQDDAMKGKVVDVVQKGYYLHRKVMRFSKVVVGE
jgi:molecular chaperone GrpE